MADLQLAHARRRQDRGGARLGSEGDLSAEPKTLALGAADVDRADGEEASAPDPRPGRARLFRRGTIRRYRAAMSAARPLFLRKRKSIRDLAMSQTCLEPTYAVQQIWS